MRALLAVAHTHTLRVNEGVSRVVNVEQDHFEQLGAIKDLVASFMGAPLSFRRLAGGGRPLMGHHEVRLAGAFLQRLVHWARALGGM